MNDYNDLEFVLTKTLSLPDAESVAENLIPWLAEVERAAAEKAWWEGQRAGWEECADPGAFVNDLHDAKTPNPYRKEQ